jgi:pilus assembly protein Flp/PilA
MLSNLMDYLSAAFAAMREESGQAMVEYGLIVALVSVVAIAALLAIGGDLKTVFTSVQTALGNAIAAA